MCILCVASRWSRRIVTMLPWLIIPLIILWALSQLLPPGFRFEVTSPRLACVGVLLLSLGWYELAMPRLSMWRARRSALLRERRRIEAQEAAKWRKEATRRCRNCLSAYRDQTPGGGRFMCTFCGHVSKRPVLDVPGAPVGVGITGGMAPGGPLGAIQQTNSAGSVSGGLFGSRTSRGWGGRGWPERGWVSGGKGWIGNKAWVGTPAGVGWGSGTGSWGATNWPGRSWTGAAYWGGGNGGAGVGIGAGTWTGNGYGGGIFAGESCVAGDGHHGGLFLVLYKGFSFIFFCLRWVWRKLWRGERPGEDGSVNGGRRSGQKKGEEGGVSQGSRVDKARRKAEEKRQARLEREQLEAEERRQREEVARLVEERRRQRDEMLEAEKESEREAAAERERELRKERDAGRRRQEKVKEKDKDKELTKEKSRDTDSEDSKKKKEKDHPDKKTDGEKRVEMEKKSASMPNGEVKKASKNSRGVGVELGCKGNDVPVKPGSGVCGKSGSARYLGPVKGAGVAPLKSGVTHQNNTSFWGKGLTGGLNPGSKAAKAGSFPNSNLPAGSGGSGVPNGKPTDSSYSAWNRMPWTKVWGKSSQSTTEGNVASPAGNLNLSARTDAASQNGGKPPVNGSTGSGVSDLSQGTGEAKQQAPVNSQSWQRLFSNNNFVSPPPSNPECHQESKQWAEHGNTSVDTLSAPSDSHNSLIFGHGLQGSVITQPSSVVAPVGPPVHTSSPSSVSILSSSVTSSVAGSVFTFAHGTLPPKSSVSPPVVAPTPIGKPSHQLPVHTPVSGPLHMPAPIQVPVLITSQSQTHVPQDQLPQILEPWGQPPLSLDDPSEVQSAGDKWQMWDTPQLDQRRLPSLAEPLPWNYLGSSFMNPQKDSMRTHTHSLELENQLPASLFSPQQQVGVGCSSGEFLTPLPVGNSHSLWSENFQSAMRIWETDSDSHQRVPQEFVDCITQEVMLDPVITADGHSYERAAIERWLQTHDTSPITGEVLPPPPGGYGSGVDKTLRPNHILRGQIIEYRENMARLARGPVQESTRENSWSAVGGLGLGGSAWSTIPNAEIPHIGGFYSTPGAHSLWSFNGPQNSMLPPL